MQKDFSTLKSYPNNNQFNALLQQLPGKLKNHSIRVRNLSISNVHQYCTLLPGANAVVSLKVKWSLSFFHVVMIGVQTQP